MIFENGEIYSGFRLIEKEDVEDIKSVCHVFEHVKTGARLFYAQNSDDNKVFFVSFKTPPSDECGTAHIMEHSVLCGSEKYPAKDPFNTLMKGSLNTFLNAMTYADKTVYPIASRNQEDFNNLMSVYLDAVFKPKVVGEKKIFMQEGWHYELNDKEAPLNINGVVYNEMKGAFSGPDRLLADAINKTLFTDSVYKFESGGKPEDIPELTFEKFVDFYNKYYHPSNSFFYLYGDLDILGALEHIDSGYLSAYDKKEIKNAVIDEKPHNHCGFTTETFSVPKGSKTGFESAIAFNFVVGQSADTLLSLSMNVLSYILLETNASPLKKAIIDKGIAQSVEGWFDDSTKQMVFSIVAKNASCRKIGSFKETVLSSLKNILKTGLNRDLVNSAINYYEFIFREADFGHRPKGLVYGLNIMNGWLHGQNPIEAVRIWRHFDTMREGVEKGYFENIIRENILLSPIHSMAAVAAEEGKEERIQAALQKKLGKFKESLSENEIEQIVCETKALKEYQSTPDSPETLDKIPMLKREDIKKEAAFDSFIEKPAGEGKMLFVPLDTNGIVYTKFMFSLEGLPKEMIPYAGLLARALGKVDTAGHSYETLPTEINMHTGGIDGRITVYKNKSKFTPVLSLNAKALKRNSENMFGLMKEIMLSSLFDSVDSLKKIILELKAEYERHYDNNGHAVALSRCESLISASGKYEDMAKGMAFSDFLETAVENMGETAKNMRKTADRVFTRENLTVVIAAEKELADYAENVSKEVVKNFALREHEKNGFEFEEKSLAEAVQTGSKVVYNAVCGNFINAGYNYSGKMNVVKNIINTEYLWNEVRVKGGAYGCGAGFDRTGEVYAYSYRDPNVKETYKNFEGIGDFLENITLSEKDILRYTLGAVNTVDRPKSNSERMEIAVSKYINGYKFEDVQNERNELLNVTAEYVNECGRIFKDTMRHKAMCTFGSEAKIDENAELFTEIRKLYER
ncbi:MAG: insulinase family protein [Firmicutes bacterium]|nr:insulinase family protein [Bacillota bacterium]